LDSASSGEVVLLTLESSERYNAAHNSSVHGSDLTSTDVVVVAEVVRLRSRVLVVSS
jgi:hypothetical protein